MVYAENKTIIYNHKTFDKEKLKPNNQHQENYISNNRNKVYYKGIIVPIWKEEATKKVQEIVTKHWKTIESDAILLHRLLTSAKINADLSEFEKIEGAKERLGLILTDKLYAEVKHFLKELHIKHSDSVRVSNINLRTALKDFDKDLIGHIDYMFIDKHGNLHIYNFKTSHTNPYNWSEAKKNKYKM